MRNYLVKITFFKMTILATDVVQKIATDQKDYRKCSSCVIVCGTAKICQSITVKKG